MTVQMVLPRVVGTRPSARLLLRELPEQLAGADVVLDCRGLVDGTASFADEVVKVVLVDRGAAGLVAVGPGHDFAADLATAAADHGVTERFRLERVTASAAS